MKRLLLVCIVLCTAVWNVSLAQERTVSWRVTSAEDNSALPGVNVIVKGTSSGTITDSDGRYTVTVTRGSVITFSFVGLKTQEVTVGEQSIIDVSLAQDATQLTEVVVTALGIERNKNELGYAAQQVKGDQITQARGANFVSALSGKVSGVDIKTSNTMGGSTNVVIRGYKSIGSNNQALFVIDGIPVTNANTNTAAQQAGGTGVDYGNAAADINPDNIESVNVLKGAAATALYGSRAANGVVMITTKKGRKNSFDLTINSGVTFGAIDKSTFARYQKEYGAGYTGSFGANRTYDDGSLPTVVFGDDASYGPKFDGQLVYHWDALDPFSPYYHKAKPWVAAKNDPSTFFERAVTSNQSVSITAGGANTTYKFGYTRSDEKGVLPNSTLDKNLFNFSASSELTKKLTVSASANYSRIAGIGRYGTGYSGNNVNQQFRQWWQTNVDIKEQRAAYFRNKQNVTWNWNAAGTKPLYSDNPYWTRYENYNNDARDHFFGYTTLNYKLTDWLSILGRAAYDGTADIQEERIAVGSQSVSRYRRFNRSYSESNFDLMLNFNKNINKDISFRGLLGGNMRRTYLSSIRASTNGGLVVPGLYSLSNSLNPVTPPVEEFERVGVDGVFASATFGYKDLVYVEATARQDKSTTLPQGENAYFYPSVSANFVFSEVVKTPWLTTGKVRANYAEVGNDAPALSIYNVYDKPTGFGSIPIFSLPNVQNNNNLKSENTKSVEVGVEAEFLQSRVGFDITAYKTNSFNQVLNVAVSAATGYTGKWVNSGEVQNKGIEASLFVVPVMTNDFTWTVNFNFTRNRNEVISLYGEGGSRVTNYPIASLQGGVTLNAAVGHPYGVIRGTDFVYTDGKRTVNANGYYMATSSSNEIIGDPNPDWLGGITNTLSYKGISLSFLVDIRQGGDIFSLDQWYGEATGLYANSAGLNGKGNPSRDPVASGGGILLPGVQADGSPNTVYAENLDGDGQGPFGYAANGYAGAPRAWYVYDGSYVKLREAAVTYSLPTSVISKLRAFKKVDVSLIGRNLWIIHKNMKYADPEESLSSGNANGGYQSGAYPTVRTYGFNVKLTF
jgi:TonB-linked SusC/RagA family outer membrane protein